MRVFNAKEEVDKVRRFEARMAWSSPVSPPLRNSIPPISPRHNGMTMSGSLPSLVPTEMSTGKFSTSTPGKPYGEAAAYVEQEKLVLKRRVKELEQSLKRSVSTIARERKEHQLYKQQEQQRLKEASAQREQWRAQMEHQLRLVKYESEKQLSAAQMAQRYI